MLPIHAHTLCGKGERVLDLNISYITHQKQKLTKIVFQIDSATEIIKGKILEHT